MRIFDVYVPLLHISSQDLMASFFMFSGIFYRSTEFKISNYWFLAIIVLIASACIQDGVISMRNYTALEAIPYIICAIIGSFLIIRVSEIIVSKQSVIFRFILYIGNNTLSILTWHFLSFKLVSLIIIYIKDLGIEELAYFPVLPNQGLWCILYTIVGIGIPMSFVILKEKIKKIYEQ